MQFVDRDIRAFVEHGMQIERSRTAIVDGEMENVTCIGYDLVSECFYKNSDNEQMIFSLMPGDSVFVKSKETIEFDNRTVGVVSLKNSRIRMGLSLESPVYQPGHHTKIVIRLTNLTDKEITLMAGEKYAMLMFYQLATEPDKPYQGTFQKEQGFTGMAEYQSKYASQIKEIEDKAKCLKEIERTLYGNVITILTIFVGIFTLLNLNIDLAKEAASMKSFVLFNLAVIGCISFLGVLMDELLNRKNAHHRLWLLPVVVFGAMVCLGLVL